ncbi:MAG: hypothetical protein CEN89_433 [Candidatus Berkelbacteria bacterium Licking1014_7]|uniref:Type II secretion system protein GspG C-terminal domain-containing protein n=1 Tax=Candidatus Berkelbacteria bacterium Licking1014_7 TaxID=2017147 RepID=A0A554LJ05_9BACT|nr:MAG: hypothetical protein CEN89_433 [Candidatus Berkelbacteria bacterium Licking1014_7]
MDLDFNDTNQNNVSGNPLAPAPDGVSAAISSRPNKDQVAPLGSAQSQPSVQPSVESIKPASQTSAAPVPTGKVPTPKPSVKKSHRIGLIALLVLLIVVLGGGAYFFLGTDIGKKMIGLKVNESGDLVTDNLSPSVDNAPSGEPSGLTKTDAQTNDTQRKTDLSQVKIALEAYKVDKGSYPVAGAFEHIDNAASNFYKEVAAGEYLTQMVYDPKLSDGWWYGYKSVDGKNYALTARLEDETDVDGVQSGSIILYNLTNN